MTTMTTMTTVVDQLTSQLGRRRQTTLATRAAYMALARTIVIDQPPPLTVVPASEVRLLGEPARAA